MALWGSLRLPWLSFVLIAVTYVWSLSSIHCYCHDDRNSLMAQLDFLSQCAVATENSAEPPDLSLPSSPWSQQSLYCFYVRITWEIFCKSSGSQGSQGKI